METSVTLFQQFIVEPLLSAWDQLLGFAPRIIGALLILLIGGVIAKGLEELVVKLLRLMMLDKISDQVQLSNILAKGGIRRKLSELVGMVFYWIVMLACVMTALNALNLTIAAELFQSVVSFLPNVIAAIFIFIVGVFAAAFLAAMVRTALSNAGVSQSHLLGQMAQVTVVGFASVAALQQLQIQFVGEVFLIVLSGISLGCALAFGLGCKELARKWTENLIDQIKSKK